MMTSALSMASALGFFCSLLRSFVFLMATLSLCLALAPSLSVVAPSSSNLAFHWDAAWRGSMLPFLGLPIQQTRCRRLIISRMPS